MPLFGLTPEALSGIGLSLLSLPGAYWAYSAGKRKADQEASAARDRIDIDALTARDKTIADLHLTMATTQAQLVTLSGENGRVQARCEILEANQKERDERERTRIAEIARLQERVKQMDDCQGGAPCPLVTLRRPHP